MIIICRLDYIIIEITFGQFLERCECALLLVSEALAVGGVHHIYRQRGRLPTADHGIDLSLHVFVCMRGPPVYVMYE